MAQSLRVVARGTEFRCRADLFATNTVTTSYKYERDRRAKDVRSHAPPKLPIGSLFGAPTSTTVSTPPVGVHGRREATADGMSV